MKQILVEQSWFPHFSSIWSTFLEKNVTNLLLLELFCFSETCCQLSHFYVLSAIGKLALLIHINRLWLILPAWLTIPACSIYIHSYNYCIILSFLTVVFFPIAGSDPQIHWASWFPRKRARGRAAAGRDDSLHVSGFLYDHADARPGWDVLQTHL